jgi:hypothetical protein
VLHIHRNVVLVAVKGPAVLLGPSCVHILSSLLVLRRTRRRKMCSSRSMIIVVMPGHLSIEISIRKAE